MRSSIIRAALMPARVCIVDKAPVLLVLLAAIAVGCSDDGPAGTHPEYEPIAVDVHTEARKFNGGDVYEFVLQRGPA